MNLVEAQVVGDAVRFADFDLRLPASSSLVGADRGVILGIRPTDFEHADAAPGLAHPRPRRRRRGSRRREPPDLHDRRPRVSAEAVQAAADLAADDEELFANDQRAVFTAVVGAKRATTPGSEIELAVDTAHLHFFDPATGRRRCGEAAGRVRLETSTGPPASNT